MKQHKNCPEYMACARLRHQVVPLIMVTLAALLFIIAAVFAFT